MPNLHELFDAATDGLPPLPDLAPSARRIVRRRQLATRTSAAVLSSALVVGAGTFALSAQHSGRAQDAASRTPHTYNNQYVVDTLQSLWPIKGEHLKLDPADPYAIEVTQDGRTVARIFFQVNPDVDLYPALLVCSTANAADGSCTTGTTSDGDHVLAETQKQTISTDPGPSKLVYKTIPASPGQSVIATMTPPPKSTETVASPGFLHAQRLHDSYLGQLTIMGVSFGPGALPTGRQLLDLVKSPAYEQLIVSAIAVGSFEYLGTPPATTPTPTTPVTVPATVPATTVPATPTPTAPVTVPATVPAS